MQEEEEKAAVAHLARRHGLLVLLRLTVISVVLCMCACVHGGVVRPEGRRELHGVVSSVSRGRAFASALMTRGALVSFCSVAQ